MCFDATKFTCLFVYLNIEQLDSEFGKEFVSAKRIVYIKKPNRVSPRPIKIIRSRIDPSGKSISAVLLFKDVKTRNEADYFRDYEVYIINSDRYILEENEYLVRDIVGLKCFVNQTKTVRNRYKFDIDAGVIKEVDEINRDYVPNRGIFIGFIVDVISPEMLCSNSKCISVMHSILEIQKQSDNSRFMVPFVDPFVSNIDIRGGYLSLTNLPHGLMSMSYKEQSKRTIIKGYLPCSR